jgi:hypothetical protein
MRTSPLFQILCQFAATIVLLTSCNWESSDSSPRSFHQHYRAEFDPDDSDKAERILEEIAESCH